MKCASEKEGEVQVQVNVQVQVEKKLGGKGRCERRRASSLRVNLHRCKKTRNAGDGTVASQEIKDTGEQARPDEIPGSDQPDECGRC